MELFILREFSPRLFILFVALINAVYELWPEGSICAAFKIGHRGAFNCEIQ